MAYKWNFKNCVVLFAQTGIITVDKANSAMPPIYGLSDHQTWILASFLWTPPLTQRSANDYAGALRLTLE